MLYTRSTIWYLQKSRCPECQVNFSNSTCPASKWSSREGMDEFEGCVLQVYLQNKKHKKQIFFFQFTGSINYQIKRTEDPSGTYVVRAPDFPADSQQIHHQSAGTNIYSLSLIGFLEAVIRHDSNKINLLLEIKYKLKLYILTAELISLIKKRIELIYSFMV